MHMDLEDLMQNRGGGAPAPMDTFPAGPYIPEALDCQRCGQCLRGCPTYKVNPVENQGPRGRVRLIERVLRKNEPLNADDREALTACTLCRTCETLCPSKMDYGALYQQAMAALAPPPTRDPVVGFLLRLFTRGGVTRAVLPSVIHLYQRSGAQSLVRRLPETPKTKTLKQAEALLPGATAFSRLPRQNPAQIPARRGRALLFTGCVAQSLDRPTHQATIKLLTELGFDVRVNPELTCCGALHVHNGDLAQAKTLARANLAAFADCGADVVLSNASGCGAFLNEYKDLLNGDAASEGPLPPPVLDILQFLSDENRIGGLSFRALKKRVAVHEPCSHRNLLKSQATIYTALSAIPDLEVIPLPDNAMCCGAGGLKMVMQPDLAAPPREEKVQAFLDSGAEMLLTTNLTCALHLGRGLRDAGHPIEVLHPVSMLARQLA